MDNKGALTEIKYSIDHMNLWPEGDSNREMIIELLNAVSLLLKIEIEREDNTDGRD